MHAQDLLSDFGVTLRARDLLPHDAADESSGADQHDAAAAAELEEARDTDALGVSGTAEDVVLDRQDIHDGGRPSPRPTLRKHKRGGEDIPPPARSPSPGRRARAAGTAALVARARMPARR